MDHTAATPLLPPPPARARWYMQTPCTVKPLKPPKWATKLSNKNIKTCRTPGCYNDGGRFRSWETGFKWTNTNLVLEYGRGYPHWTMKVPTGVCDDNTLCIL